MSDAKSRFEIVDELTDKKLQMLDEISKLNDSIIVQQNSIEQTKRNQLRQKEQMERQQKENVEDMLANQIAHKKNCESRKNELTLKIDAIDESIEAIKAISTTKKEPEK